MKHESTKPRWRLRIAAGSLVLLALGFCLWPRERPEQREPSVATAPAARADMLRALAAMRAGAPPASAHSGPAPISDDDDDDAYLPPPPGMEGLPQKLIKMKIRWSMTTAAWSLQLGQIQWLQKLEHPTQEQLAILEQVKEAAARTQESIGQQKAEIDAYGQPKVDPRSTQPVKVSSMLTLTPSDLRKLHGRSSNAMTDAIASKAETELAHASKVLASVDVPSGLSDLVQERFMNVIVAGLEQTSGMSDEAAAQSMDARRAEFISNVKSIAAGSLGMPQGETLIMAPPPMASLTPQRPPSVAWPNLPANTPPEPPHDGPAVPER